MWFMYGGDSAYVTHNVKWFFDTSYIFSTNTPLILRRNERDMIINVYLLTYSMVQSPS